MTESRLTCLRRKFFRPKLLAVLGLLGGTIGLWYYFNDEPVQVLHDEFALVDTAGNDGYTRTDGTFESGQNVGETIPVSDGVTNCEDNAEPSVATSTEDLIPDRLEGLQALTWNLRLLEIGQKRLAETPGYAATFCRQERIDGQMLPAETMQLKIRHEPFSVYMKWIVGDRGREVLYVEGQNDGKLLMHYGGWKARFLPCFKIDPHGSLALRESRYAITRVGLLKLASKLIDDRRKDLANKARMNCQMLSGQKFNDRICYYFEMEYADQDSNGEYRRSESFIDSEFSLPVAIKNYGWPDETTDTAKIDELTLVEHYRFTEIEMAQGTSDTDFDSHNAAYAFQK